MNRDAVRTAFEDFMALDFPSHPTDPDLADWIMELLDVDTYYAGLATTVIDLGKIHPPPAHILDELKQWLVDVRVVGAVDKAILRHSYAYLERLIQLDSALRS